MASFMMSNQSSMTWGVGATRRPLPPAGKPTEGFLDQVGLDRMTAVEFLIDNIVVGLFQGPNRPPAIRVDWQNTILGAVRDENGRGSAAPPCQANRR